MKSAFLTLLVFLLLQGLGSVLLLAVGMDVTFISFVLMAADVLAVLCCWLLLHNIRFAAAFDTSSVRWLPGLLAIGGGIMGSLSISILADKIKLPDEVLQLSLQMSHNVWGLMTLVLVGPLSEELIFREGIIGGMLRGGSKPWVAIIVSALAFSAMHFNLAQGFYAFPLGVIFGIIYYKTGNVVLTSLLHILNNAIAAFQIRATSEDFADFSYAEWFGSAATAYTLMVVFGILCVLLMYVFWRRYVPCEKSTPNAF